MLLRALPIFRELEDAAPDDIRDDWKIVVDGLTALEDALDDAGVDPATYDRDDPPEGVSDEDEGPDRRGRRGAHGTGLGRGLRGGGAAGPRRLQDATASVTRFTRPTPVVAAAPA